jgi:hypothetical protein
LALLSYAAGSCLVLIEIAKIIMKVDAMFLQKGVYLQSGFKAQHLPKRRLGKKFCAVAL